MHAELLQLCLILCNSMHCSLPGSSVHGIVQARILEWVDMPSSRGLLEEVVINPTIELLEVTQDWGNRLLEGTNKTFCTPGPRRKEQ